MINRIIKIFIIMVKIITWQCVSWHIWVLKGSSLSSWSSKSSSCWSSLWSLDSGCVGVRFVNGACTMHILMIRIVIRMIIIIIMMITWQLRSWHGSCEGHMLCIFLLKGRPHQCSHTLIMVIKMKMVVIRIRMMIIMIFIGIVLWIEGFHTLVQGRSKQHQHGSDRVQLGQGTFCHICHHQIETKIC